MGAANRSILISVGVALLLGLALMLAFRPSLYAPYDEGTHYLDIANGDYALVYNFYAGRVLHPLAVRFLARAEHSAIDARTFRAVSEVSLVALFVLIGWYYATEYLSTGTLWVFLLVSAAVIDAYRNYYWHELFYAALCALFFLALRTSAWLGLPFLFLLYLTRESTIVLVTALFLIAALQRKWKLSLGVLAVAAAAIKVQGAFVARALPNHHGIPTIFLDFLRIPYNFAYNLCGLEIWTNTIADTMPSPVWTMHIPGWAHLGNIHQVGYCGFVWQNPVHTFLLMLSAFGILPIAIFRMIDRERAKFLLGRLDISTALVYGTLAYLLAPLVGTTPSRYLIYGWPAFWIAAVGYLDRSVLDWRKRIEIVALSVLAAWIPAIVRLFTGPAAEGPDPISAVTSGGMIVALLLMIAIYAIAWQRLRPVEGKTAPENMNSAAAVPPRAV